MAHDHSHADDHGHDHADDHDHDHDHKDHGHSHSHGHGHSHGPGGHHHAPKDMGRAFAIGVALNSVFVAAEVVIGLYSGSMALLADAGHNLSDVLSLILAWVAIVLAKACADGAADLRTCARRTILASLTNAVLLFVAVGAIASESIHRFLVAGASSVESNRAGHDGRPAMGVVINTATALLFMRGSHEDLNVRGAFLHMADRRRGLTGRGDRRLRHHHVYRHELDRPGAVSLLIVAVIVIGSWGLLRDSVDLAMDAALQAPDRRGQAVRAWLAHRPGVSDIHDLHVWAMSTTETALSPPT
jgi:cobalt-zinc-cadmium efflux system protein